MKVFLFFISLVSSFLARAQEPLNYALVTGASRGIGKALVEILAEKTSLDQVFAVARNEKDLKDLATLHMGKIIPVAADIGQAEGLEKIQKTVQSVLGETGRLVYLVHNAALITPLGDVEYLRGQPLSETLSRMDETYRINAIAPHLYTNAFKSWFLTASASQQIFGLHSRLASRQWSFAPDAKICAASLSNSQILNSFVYTDPRPSS